LVGARSSICSKAMVFQLDHNGKLFDAGTLSRFSKAGRRKKALSGKACGTASPEPTPPRPTGNTARGRHEAIRSGKRQRRVDTRSAPPPQNSHRFNTHHYQLTNASYSVAQGSSLRPRRLCRCSMYLRLAHYFCSTECVRSLLVCQSRAIRIVSRRSGDVVADDGPRLRPTDWAERNFHELTEIFAGCGIITCVAAFTARDRRRMPLLELGAPGGRRGARRWGR
jgi:hypothetical protein